LKKNPRGAGSNDCENQLETAISAPPLLKKTPKPPQAEGTGAHAQRRGQSGEHEREPRAQQKRMNPKAARIHRVKLVSMFEGKEKK